MHAAQHAIPGQHPGFSDRHLRSEIPQRTRLPTLERVRLRQAFASRQRDTRQRPSPLPLPLPLGASPAQQAEQQNSSPGDVIAEVDEASDGAAARPCPTAASALPAAEAELLAEAQAAIREQQSAQATGDRQPPYDAAATKARPTISPSSGCIIIRSKSDSPNLVDRCSQCPRMCLATPSEACPVNDTRLIAK